MGGDENVSYERANPFYTLGLSCVKEYYNIADTTTELISLIFSSSLQGGILRISSFVSYQRISTPEVDKNNEIFYRSEYEQAVKTFQI